MKRKRMLFLCGAGALLLAASKTVVWNYVFAASLTSGSYSNGVFAFTIKDATAGSIFEIYSRDYADQGEWRWVTNGTVGQTNFSIETGPYTMQFYRALACDNCDGDSVPNTQDANPFDSSVGALTITIDTPANGSNLQ